MYKRQAYWWTTEIAELREKYLKLRRAVEQSRNREDANRKSAEHTATNKHLRLVINWIKGSRRSGLVEEVNVDQWGLGYKDRYQEAQGLYIALCHGCSHHRPYCTDSLSQTSDESRGWF